MPELPWDWVPPHASETARKEWQKPWKQRIQEALYPNETTFRNYMLTMIESFTVEELALAIRERKDLVDMAVTVGKIRWPVISTAARMVVRQNQYWMFYYLVGWPGYLRTGPLGILYELRVRDSYKARMLSEKVAWEWFQGECWELYRFFRDFARLKDWPAIPPPPGHAPRILEGAASPGPK